MAKAKETEKGVDHHPTNGQAESSGLAERTFKDHRKTMIPDSQEIRRNGKGKRSKGTKGTGKKGGAVLGQKSENMPPKVEYMWSKNMR